MTTPIDPGRTIDHRQLAALVTRFAIDHYHAAVKLRETAYRMGKEAQSLLDEGDKDKHPAWRKPAERLAIDRRRRWELWQDLAGMAESTAQRDDSAHLRDEREDWPPRGAIVDGRLYLAVPADPDDGDAGTDRLLILDPATALVDVAAAVALGPRPESPDDEARDAAAALDAALARIVELQPRYDRLARASRTDALPAGSR
jgi:hypothetical protein